MKKNNKNKPITYNQVELVIKKLPTNKFPGQDGIKGEFYEIFRGVNIYSQTSPTN